MKTPEVDSEEVGTLLIDLKAGEGSFYLDTDAHAWNAIGRIGQLDILSDWINLLQKLYDTASEQHKRDFAVDVEYDERKRVHDSTIPERKIGEGE
tara:strand:+ start:297 stop:581 length:285 start_codon:yes stop_codon:yes gene_type:complete